MKGWYRCASSSSGHTPINRLPRSSESRVRKTTTWATPNVWPLAPRFSALPWRHPTGSRRAAHTPPPRWLRNNPRSSRDDSGGGEGDHGPVLIPHPDRGAEGHDAVHRGGQGAPALAVKRYRGIRPALDCSRTPREASCSAFGQLCICEVTPGPAGGSSPFPTSPCAFWSGGNQAGASLRVWSGPRPSAMCRRRWLHPSTVLMRAGLPCCAHRGSIEC
jgi:hypothetical protein